MRSKRLGWIGGVGAVFAFSLLIVSRGFEAAQAGSPGAVTPSVADMPSDPRLQMAVLRGKIRFTGTVPTPALLNMSSDPVCASFVNMAENIRVNDQGLENVMVYVSSPVGGIAPNRSSVTLDQRNCRFDPHVLTLQVGQTLIVRNSDPTLQNVHAFSQVNSPFNIGQPVPMASTHIFDKPEAQIPIRDEVHRWKSAIVGVFSHPYHTVSKAGGLYELQLPAGSYDITVWHEKYGMSQQSVSVKAGENPELDFVYSAP